MRGQIWKKKINGDSLSQLTTEGKEIFPTWSPDGKWIAYDSDKDSPNGMKFIWKVSIADKNHIRIAYEPTQGEIRMPYWGANNKIYHIRYVGVTSSEIFSMNADGSDAQRLTTNNSSDNYLRYTLLSDKLTYTSQPLSGPSGMPQIWVMNADGTDKKQLTQIVGTKSDWNPDGTKIVYLHYNNIRISESEGVLWTMNADGSNKKPLTYNILK